MTEPSLDMETFLAQNKKLVEAMEVYSRTVQVPTRPPASVAVEAQPAPVTSVVRRASGGPISIDLGGHDDRPVGPSR